MKNIMPQEIEVWYLIPALRKELAKIFINDYNMSQKKSAEILGITEAAVSQYLKSKRGNEMNFSEDEMKKIRRTAGKIIKDEKNLVKNLYDLCNLLKKSQAICEIHKSQDKNIPGNCSVCFNR
ncbi:MAG: transcriptional regulator [archaeon]